MTKLDDLLAKPDQQSILDGEVLPELRAQRVRVTDWIVGSLTRGAAYAIAKLRAMTRQSISTIAAIGFGDYVFGFVPLPNATAEEQADLLKWAPIVAKQTHGIDAIEATYTLRNITLTNSTATPYNAQAGRITIVFPSGNRYVSAADYVSAGNDAVIVSFRSEFTVDSLHGRSYSDPPGTSDIQLVTATYTGVTATNPALTFGPVAQVGSGLGTVTPSGSPGGPYTIKAVITASGNVGGGSWSSSIGGGALTPQGAIGILANLGGSGITLTPANNGGSPAFVKDTTFYITAPGTDVTQVGRDAETPLELGARWRAVYPLLSFARDAAGNAVPISPTLSGYQVLVLTAFPEVKTCLVLTSNSVNNEVNIYVAGQGALLPSSVVAQVQAFLNAFQMLTDFPVVAAPSIDAIALGSGTVKVHSAQAASAKAEAQRRVGIYLAGVDAAAPLPFGGLIDRSYLISLIRSTPGVTHVDDALTIGGSNGTAATDYQLSAHTMPTYAGDVGSSLAWQTV
jgi:hypothetical protein